LKANEAALARLDAIDSSHQAEPETITRLRAEYADRIRQLRDGSSEAVSRLYSADFEDLACQLLHIERETVITMRNEKAISDQALRRIQRDIDLAEARLQRPA
jgi:monovalent cation/hydrogen antiporter